MALNAFKSVIYNRKSKTTDDYSVLYEKVFLYNEVKEKLKHNLTVMPKDKINGKVYIWKFKDGKNSEILKMSMDEKFQNWKHEYSKFINNFKEKAYIYYITTVDGEKEKHYRTIIVLIPKKDPYDSIPKLLDKTNIEFFIKNSFSNKLKEMSH